MNLNNAARGRVRVGGRDKSKVRKNGSRMQDRVQRVKFHKGEEAL